VLDRDQPVAMDTQAEAPASRLATPSLTASERDARVRALLRPEPMLSFGPPR
jgi:hypothetical protein